MRRAVILALLLAAALGCTSTMTVTKTPFEAFNIGMDFTGQIGTDGMTLVAVVATNAITRADATAAIIAASPAPSIVPSTDQVTFRVQGGSNGQRFILGVRVSDNTTGELFEGEITLLVESGNRAPGQ
jgi:hypothetical protein